jgi:hypothetical protein
MVAQHAPGIMIAIAAAPEIHRPADIRPNPRGKAIGCSSLDPKGVSLFENTGKVSRKDAKSAENG